MCLKDVIVLVVAVLFVVPYLLLRSILWVLEGK